jgi:hypothetical protein
MMPGSSVRFIQDFCGGNRMTTHICFDMPRQGNFAVFARKIHRLGERPLCELFRELDRGADLRATLEIYAALPREIVIAFKGDRFESLREFHGGRR